MSLVRNFGKIITSCKKEYRKKRYGMFKLFDNISEGSVLCFGDNADFMKYLLQKKDMAGKIAQIYIDPPFFSKATYEATVSVTNEAGEELDGEPNEVGIYYAVYEGIEPYTGTRSAAHADEGSFER